MVFPWTAPRLWGCLLAFGILIVAFAVIQVLLEDRSVTSGYGGEAGANLRLEQGNHASPHIVSPDTFLLVPSHHHAFIGNPSSYLVLAVLLPICSLLQRLAVRYCNITIFDGSSPSTNAIGCSYY